MYIHELWHWTAVEPTTMRVKSLWTPYCRQSSSTPAKTKINMQIAVWGWSVLRSTPIIPSFTRVSSHALYFRNSRQTFLICVYTILNGNNCKRKCVMWFLCMEYIIFVSNGWKDVRRAKPWYTYTSILFAVLMVILIFFSSSSFFSVGLFFALHKLAYFVDYNVERRTTCNIIISHDDDHLLLHSVDFGTHNCAYCINNMRHVSLGIADELILCADHE